MLDKLVHLQATCRPGAVARVQELLAHEDFQLSNPNRARSVLHAFAASDPTGFHAADGSGHRLVGEQVTALDALNPQVAARLAGTFSSWRRFDEGRQASARAALEGILAGTPPATCGRWWSARSAEPGAPRRRVPSGTRRVASPPGPA